MNASWNLSNHSFGKPLFLQNLRVIHILEPCVDRTNWNILLESFVKELFKYGLGTKAYSVIEMQSPDVLGLRRSHDGRAQFALDLKGLLTAYQGVELRERR